ncbi:MAG TPA: hypothetical protein VF753_17485 [Terriglobales bacterium]
MPRTVAIAFCLLATLACFGQEVPFPPPPVTGDPAPAPVLSGYAAFVPTWDAGSPTLVSIVSPVLLVPIGNNFLLESRGAFEGDFQRRDGTTGDFTGAIQKTLDYGQIDYIGNPYVTATAGRFLTPFNIFNERLYPNWIRDTQTDPLILPIGTGSDDGFMLRGGIPLNPAVTFNYAAYFSTLSNLAYLQSERHAGIRLGAFLPRQRFEIGMSIQHQLQDNRADRFGWHLQWQPTRLPLDIRSEGAYSREEGSGLWIEGAYRLLNLSPAVLRKTQLVARTQVFNVGTIPGSNPDLATIDTRRTEFGVNYYLNDGWKALASYGRTFTPAGDSNIWTVGMTYRFVLALGPRQ